jgi:hypothetical protein
MVAFHRELFDRIVLIYNPANPRVSLTLAESMWDVFIANDHRCSTRRMPLVAAVLDGRARHLDLLRLTVRTDNARWCRYAHSYIGLGLTPLMAIRLKRDMKGAVMELISVIRTFNDLEPVEIARPGGATPIQIDGEVMHVDANSQVVIDCVPHAPTTLG